MLKSLIHSLWPPKYQGIKSFSYFLPAPPKRSNGYQEKEFDRVISHLSSLGFDLLDIQIQSYSSGESGGVWVFCRLGAKTKEAQEMELNIDYQEIAGLNGSNIPIDPDIMHD